MIDRLVFFVEEPSMEAFLRALLPRFLSPSRTFEIHPIQGKRDLLANLESRLKSYAKWLPPSWRIFVLIDRDDDDCQRLKGDLEQIAARAGLCSRSRSRKNWQIVNRIAIEELEAWYFADWDAVLAAYPKVSRTVPRQPRYRNPDAISGGTWESFERILRGHGYFKGGLPKIEVARILGQRVDPARCRSDSFRCFWTAVRDAGQCCDRAE
ncbi:MAG: DUF4276 family protein [Gemmataceae bacterium]|nr:DUF4276 family protein [Gemmataceae bacterium]